MKKLLCLFLVAIMMFAVSSCGGSKEESESDLVRKAVTDYALGQEILGGITIGGNEIKTIRPNITYVEKQEEDLYRVSGQMTMIDIYGTEWKNTFDCSVELGVDGDWLVSYGGFDYTSKNWTKN